MPNRRLFRKRNQTRPSSIPEAHKESSNLSEKEFTSSNQALLQAIQNSSKQTQEFLHSLKYPDPVNPTPGFIILNETSIIDRSTRGYTKFVGPGYFNDKEAATSLPPVKPGYSALEPTVPVKPGYSALEDPSSSVTSSNHPIDTGEYETEFVSSQPPYEGLKRSGYLLRQESLTNVRIESGYETGLPTPTDSPNNSGDFGNELSELNAYSYDQEGSISSSDDLVLNNGTSSSDSSLFSKVKILILIFLSHFGSVVCDTS